MVLMNILHFEDQALNRYHSLFQMSQLYVLFLTVAAKRVYLFLLFVLRPISHGSCQYSKLSRSMNTFAVLIHKKKKIQCGLLKIKTKQSDHEVPRLQISGNQGIIVMKCICLILLLGHPVLVVVRDMLLGQENL